MARFCYKAATDAGATITGKLEADSVEITQEMLASRGLLPLEVWPEASSAGAGLDFWDRLTKVKPQELILFTKQLRTLLRAGIPIMTTLGVLEDQTSNVKLKKIAAAMAMDINGGATLYECFKKHPSTFSPLYCNLVRAGETSGSIPEVLERLTKIIEHEHKVKSDIMSALQYPIMVCITLGIAFFVLLTFVIPKFVHVYKTVGLKLPLPTVICMGMYDFLHNYWYIILSGIAGFTFALVRYLRTENGRFVKDSLILRLPVFGPLFIKTAMSRFASIFSILQSSGVPVLDSFKILGGALGNLAIAREFEKMRSRIEEGAGIARPLRSAKYFPPMVVNMVAIGEQAGNLDEMLKEVADHYDDEVAYAIAKLSESLGPVLIVGLTGVVGFFALAIYLPMWDLTKMVHH
ncbi:MAG: type II secretion system F family protein [Syntrophobacteraceae bacterium]